MNRNTAQLKETLERLYAKYSHRELIPPDPLQFVYRYSEAGDMEIAALLSAVLAYGRVEQIEKSLNNLFGRMGNSPYEFVKTFNETSMQRLGDFYTEKTGGASEQNVKELFLRLAQQEQKHCVLFENIIDFLSRPDTWLENAECYRLEEY